MNQRRAWLAARRSWFVAIAVGAVFVLGFLWPEFRIARAYHHVGSYFTAPNFTHVPVEDYVSIVVKAPDGQGEGLVLDDEPRRDVARLFRLVDFSVPEVTYGTPIDSAEVRKLPPGSLSFSVYCVVTLRDGSWFEGWLDLQTDPYVVNFIPQSTLLVPDPGCGGDFTSAGNDPRNVQAIRDLGKLILK